ncbi:MAG: FKBP-type peptidyl-prolyl cis-trans isomerase [Burkholderiales bacterium]|nr:FKBP-type peptidyl-prolyl cis-trans isomerase [Phycisphaerae bacterium]
MRKNTQSPVRSRVRSPLFVEALEGRQFLSATIGATDGLTPSAATVATSAKVVVGSTATILGQTQTLQIRVSATSGTPRGTIQLVNGRTNMGIEGTLNRFGRVTFTFDAGRALYVGNYKVSARYLGNSTFVGTKSPIVRFDVNAPTLTNAGNGLRYATVTTGRGRAAQPGAMITAQYTGFDANTGVMFDQSSNHAPGTFSFQLYANPQQVIAGFDQGTRGMRTGEVRVLVIPSNLGYNDGLTRIFVLKLVSLA